jgi:four helix bundle protein
MAGVKDYRELHAWKMGRQLADRAIAVAVRQPVNSDRDLSNQILRAARSVPANIAEGFGRRTPGDFARFLRIAKGSALEIREHIDECSNRQLITAAEAEQLQTLVRRVVGTIIPLLKYLESLRKL